MDETKEEDLDMDEIEVEEVLEAAVVAVAVMVKAVEEEAIKIVKTKMENRITIMDLIQQILQENLHLNNSQLLFKIMYRTIFVLKRVKNKRGLIIIITVISQQ